MAKCAICGKGVVFGANVSHSNRKTNRTWKPNIRKVKADINGTHETVYICSRCLRSGKLDRLQRPVKESAPVETVAAEQVVEEVAEVAAENA